MVELTAPMVALQGWYRLVRAHRAAVRGGRVGEAELLSRQMAAAEARYWELARSATTQQGAARPATAAAKVGAGEYARVVRFGEGCAPHPHSTRPGADRYRVLLGRVGLPRR